LADTVNIALALARHPESSAPALTRIDARVSRTAEGVLAVTYTVEGDLDGVCLPEACPSRIGNRLWEHTCFEIFIARIGFAGYHEFNFAPSGEWAAYQFAGYRQAVPVVAETLAPQIVVRNTKERFELEATLQLARLSSDHAKAKLSHAVAAVIEDKGGALSYWALKHPPGKPDFHHADAFMLALQ